MNRETVIQSLIDLGMSTGEARTYVALIVEGASEATPLAKKAGVPQPKIYEYLKNLEQRNFLMEFETKGRAKSYEAISYKKVLEMLEKNIYRKIKDSKKFFDNLSEPDASTDEGIIHVKVGISPILIEIESVISKARKNVLIIENQFYSEFFAKMADKYQIDFHFITPSSTPNWLSSIKMKVVGKMKDKVMSDISKYQPAYLVIDVDYKEKNAKLALIASPESETEDAFVVIFKHAMLVNYQVRFILSVLEALQEQNILDQVQ